MTSQPPDDSAGSNQPGGYGSDPTSGWAAPSSSGGSGATAASAQSSSSSPSSPSSEPALDPNDPYRYGRPESDPYRFGPPSNQPGYQQPGYQQPGYPPTYQQPGYQQPYQQPGYQPEQRPQDPYRFGPPQQPFPAPPPYTNYPQPPARSGLATAGLVLGIIGLVLAWIPVLGVILGILAFIFGAVSLRSARGQQVQHGNNRGFAIAALILGGLATLACTIWSVYVFSRVADCSIYSGTPSYNLCLQND